MSFIAVNSASEFIRLEINGSDRFQTVDAAFVVGEAANVLTVPALQDITVNATPGTFRWKQLDSLSEYVLTTASTNSLSATIVLDPVSFFEGQGDTDGIFDLTNDKELVYFRLYWQGNSTGDRYIQGSGYLTALAPTLNADAPVWTSPFTIEITEDFEQGTVSA
jgi:hypothetical protein